jgi:hypothetical protein
MGFFDRLFGRARGEQPQSYQPGGAWPGFPGPAPYGQRDRGPQDRPGSADEQAVRRYQYLLATAPPERIEQAHEEAFAQLTPQQRQLVLQQLATVNPSERPADDSPRSLARYATRTEMRNPGTLTRTLGTAGGMGMGGMLLTTMAGAFIGTAIASEMFDNDGFMDWDTGGDAGFGGEAAAGDIGNDVGGDVGGDVGFFGGGEFGGGDFGGGDFGGF